MTRKLMLLLTLLVSSVCFGQMQVQDTPDCQIGLDSNGTNTDSAVIDNRFIGCTSWTLYYSSTGFSADSLEFQSAPDSSGAPGAFVTWANIDSGSSLPLTSTTGGQVMGFRFQPWAKIHINSTTGTGRIIAKLIGYKPFKGATDPTNGSQLVTIASGTINAQGTSASGTSNAGINPVLVACDASGGSVSANQISNIKCGTNGSILTLITQTAADGTGNAFAGSMSAPGGAGLVLQIFPFEFNGTSWDRQWYCSKTAKLNALGAATTQIVALSGATKIRICSAVISNNNATATTLKFVEGTGANCATGQTDVTALMNIGATSTAPISLQWGNGGALITTTGGDALCLTSSAASALETTITFDQH